MPFCQPEVGGSNTWTILMMIPLRGQLHLLGGGAGSSNSSEVWSETFGWAPTQPLPMVSTTIVKCCQRMPMLKFPTFIEPIPFTWTFICPPTITKPISAPLPSEESNCYPQVDGQEIPTDGCGAQISSHQFLLAGGRTCPTCAFVYNSDSGVITDQDSGLGWSSWWIWTTLISSDIWSRVGDMSHGRSSHGCTSYSSPEPGYENSILPKEIPVTHSLNLKHFFGTLERNVYSSLNNDAPKKGGSVNRNPNPKQLFNVPPKLTIRTSKSTFDNFEVFFGNPKS